MCKLINKVRQNCILETVFSEVVLQTKGKGFSTVKVNHLTEPARAFSIADSVKNILSIGCAITVCGN